MILSQHVDNSEWRKSLLAAAELGDPRALDIYNRCLEREGRHAEKIGYTSKPILPVSARGLVAGLTLCGFSALVSTGDEGVPGAKGWRASQARRGHDDRISETTRATLPDSRSMWRAASS